MLNEKYPDRANQVENGWKFAVKRNSQLEIDITDNKLAQTAFTEAEEKLRAIANASRNAIILIDAAGKVTFWNNGSKDMFGYR